MRPSVRAAFVPFTARFEGVVPFLYLDVLGLVTVGIGNLVDASATCPDAPWTPALSLPFLHADGSRASRDEVIAEWDHVKGLREMAPLGGLAFRSVTSLHLDAAGIDAVVQSRLALDDAELARVFAGYPDWPADAQLALLSMAWAMGPDFYPRWPHFTAAARAADFRGCALDCQIKTTGNRGVIARNTANVALFSNAAKVVDGGLDPETLWYPRSVTSTDDEPPPTTRPEAA